MGGVTGPAAVALLGRLAPRAGLVTPRQICSLLPESWPVRPARLRFPGWQLSLTGHLNRGNLSTKCSGLLLRSSFAILTARTRHLISVAPMPAFSVASRPSNSSDIDALISIPKHKSINGCPKNAGRCPKKAEPFDRRSQPATSFVQKRHSRGLPVLAARDLKNSDGQTSSKNRSLNRDVERPSVGTIFAQ